MVARNLDMVFSGWVGTDPDVKKIRDDLQVTSFRLSHTPRMRVDGDWIDGESLWVTVKCWGRLGENVAESVRKGQPIIARGRLESNSWEGSDGKRRSSLVLTASELGHDLNHGIAVFDRPAAPAAASVPVETVSTVAPAPDPWVH
ncbi:MAG: single-stranded DNA-binding protein [Varibaculum sp.]|nr:single-stranded DNA-binding protein [Varibaculum sp.]